MTEPVSYTLRLPWADKAKRVRTVREVVRAYAMTARLPKGVAHARVTLTWHPRAAFRTDALNLAPMLKAATDGLVDYGLIPDDTPQYVTEHCAIGEPQKPGCFLLHIEVTDP